jgi:hypothetical protein
VKRKIAKQHSKNEKQTTNKVLITCVQIITCYVYKMKHIVYQFLIHSSLCSTTLKIPNFAIAEYKYITNQVSECQDPTEKKLCQFFSSVSETTRQRKRFTKSFSKQSDREKGSLRLSLRVRTSSTFFLLCMQHTHKILRWTDIRTYPNYNALKTKSITAFSGTII